MRAQLVDWMMEVSASFLVRRRTLQTAVNYCDRYLAACPRAFPRDRLQLLGACVAACLHAWHARAHACTYIGHRPLQGPHTPPFPFPSIAVTALFVAAKMEEIYPPKAQEMAATTGGASSAREIVAFEQELMTTLGWNLAPPTVDDWAEGCVAVSRYMYESWW